MTTISAADVQKLREATGAGMMDAKKALLDAAGDFAKAEQLIAERGLAKAEKKAERSTGAGVLEAYIHNGRIGVLLEVRCETDFVGRSEPFKALAHDLAMHIAAMNPATVEELLSQPSLKNPEQTIDAVVKSVIAKTGENIQVARFSRFAL